MIVAYFLDGNEPRAWLDGVLAGAWIAITHTFSALVLAIMLKLASTAGLFSALAHNRLLELVSYALIVAVGGWRLRVAMAGRAHDCGHHAHDHQCGHEHGHHHAGHHERRAGRPRGFFHRTSGLVLLSAAGVAPCAGALILILLALALDVPWAGVVGVLAIAAGMTVALAGLGFASMLAHRLIIVESQARDLGRFVSMGASVVVIATGAILILGAAARQMGWAA
ncbi:hypothetical protein [Reyranella sp.]|uniref:hypothetical protein n=1 Tax=Reyranella sp. TaxID=1929291 RepID=UPI003BAD334C